MFSVFNNNDNSSSSNNGVASTLAALNGHMADRDYAALAIVFAAALVDTPCPLAPPVATCCDTETAAGAAKQLSFRLELACPRTVAMALQPSPVGRMELSLRLSTDLGVAPAADDEQVPTPVASRFAGAAQAGAQQNELGESLVVAKVQLRRTASNAAIADLH